MSPSFSKQEVREFWEEAPCGTRDVTTSEESEAFAEVERQRDEREPFIAEFAQFDRARGKRLLEVGVGAGTDHVRFARAGALCTGVDLTDAAIEWTRRRLQAEGLESDLHRADAESLPFGDDYFDIVYSWGVIHHTPDTRQSAAEILRVLRPGGRFCVMVYNRRSLLALQAWLVFGLLRGTPSRSLDYVIANHVESAGTKAYSASSAKSLFASATTVGVSTVVTAYDMRIGRRRFLPPWTWRAIPSRFGWFHVVTGYK